MANYCNIEGVPNSRLLNVSFVGSPVSLQGRGTGGPGSPCSGTVRPLRRAVQLAVTHTEHACDGVAWVGRA